MTEKTCPLKYMAIMFALVQGKSVSLEDIGSECLGKDCQLWWFCSGSLIERLDNIERQLNGFYNIARFLLKMKYLPPESLLQKESMKEELEKLLYD